MESAHKLMKSNLGKLNCVHLYTSWDRIKYITVSTVGNCDYIGKEA